MSGISGSAAGEVHIFLSPHLDDAVLSCGGTIHRLGASRVRVLVVTVCAGAPAEGALSSYGAELHDRWAEPSVAPEQMVAARRAEDRAALSILGADWLHLDVLDAPYRRDPTSGAWLYVGDEALFGSVAAGDTEVAASISSQLSDLFGRLGREPAGVPEVAGVVGPAGVVGARSPVVYSPLAVGNHVDHQLVRLAAEQWAAEQSAADHGRLVYYEDFPYAADDSALTDVIGAEPGARLDARLSRLEPDDLDTKVEAVKAYRSQISTFWSDAEDMAASVREFAARRGETVRPAERLWESLPGRG